MVAATRHLRPIVDVSVVIPTIPGRGRLLTSALESVHAQSVEVAMTRVEEDLDRTGAAATRNRALREVNTEWVAFLDDDDHLYHDHIRLCLAMALHHEADLVYPWFDVQVDGYLDNARDPLAAPHRGRMRTPLGLQFGDEQRDHVINTANFIPVTVLARTEAIRAAGGFPEDATDCEDWQLWRRMLLDGAKFVHLPKRTWVWNWHDKHTKGRGK